MCPPRDGPALRANRALVAGLAPGIIGGRFIRAERLRDAGEARVEVRYFVRFSLASGLLEHLYGSAGG